MPLPFPFRFIEQFPIGIVGKPLRGVRRKRVGKRGHPRTGVPTDSNEHLTDKSEFDTQNSPRNGSSGGLFI